LNSGLFPGEPIKPESGGPVVERLKEGESFEMVAMIVGKKDVEGKLARNG
jgi:hypothetical protein